MSLSNPTTKITNPAEIFIEWDGAKGLPYYYDKTEKQNFELKLPLRFIVLDELSTIKGFNKNLKCGIYSNEIRNTTTDPLRVRTFKDGFKAQGFYQEIKSDIVAAGGKFARSIYIAMNHKGKMITANISLVGGAFSEWYDFTKNHKKAIYGNAIVINGSVEKMNGNVTYKVPSFEIKTIENPETLTNAILKDKELQEYLELYLNKKPDVVDHSQEALEANSLSDADAEELNRQYAESMQQISEDDLPF